MSNGKAKGSEFERHISKTLSKWWSKNEREDLFWRTQNSGGRFTVRQKKGFDTHHQGGDICDIHPDGKLFFDVFCIECKSYKDIGLWSIVTGLGLLVEWWKKLEEMGVQEGKHPILITKSNNKPILFFTTDYIGSLLEEICSVRPVFSTKLGICEDVCAFKLTDILSLDVDKFKQLCLSLQERCNIYESSGNQESTLCDSKA